jgi:hypothetical protein
VECVQRARLKKNYTTASVILEAARTRLHQRIGNCPTTEFLALTDELDRASDELKRASAALDAHVREHRCMV